ncbi:hypothetical protein [Furfurilactobacillus entadae]|uniref:hypothetical protein n=1 Tax=Furfurilactobacillus entadae TaxID=2922307 RepID=UPI0035F09180
MRLPKSVLAIVIVVVAILVGVVTLHPVTDQPQQPVATSSSTKKQAQDQTKTSSNKPVKESTKAPVETETVAGFTLTKTASKLPSALSETSAPTGWSTPITLTVGVSSLAGTSEADMYRFDGLHVGTDYRIWVKPVGATSATSGYVINYRPTSSSMYVPTKLLRIVANAAEKDDDTVTQLTLYNSAKD